VTNIKLIIFFV